MRSNFATELEEIKSECERLHRELAIVRERMKARSKANECIASEDVMAEQVLTNEISRWTARLLVIGNAIKDERRR